MQITLRVCVLRKEVNSGHIQIDNKKIPGVKLEDFPFLCHDGRIPQ